jgi:hypothetical protein
MVQYRGGVNEMADGTQQMDLVNTTAKRIFRLTLSLVTATEKTTVLTAWATIKQASATFEDMDSNSFTVTRLLDADLEWTAALTANGLRWSAVLNLKEV